MSNVKVHELFVFSNKKLKGASGQTDAGHSSVHTVVLMTNIFSQYGVLLRNYDFCLIIGLRFYLCAEFFRENWFFLSSNISSD